MFTTLLVFVKTPLGKKLLVYSCIAIAALILLRRMTNKAWEQGFDKGKTKGIEELTKAKEAEWEEKQKAIDAHIQELEQAKADTLAERQQVAASRISLKSDLAKGITSLREELNRSAGEVAQIPASELDAAIRQNLAALR